MSDPAGIDSSGTALAAMGDVRAESIGVSEVEAMTNSLVDEYRSRCLWFLRPEYYPTTVEERLRVLGYIERYGDVAAFRRAAILRQWLSLHFNGTSVGC